MENLKRTPLYDEHVRLGAKMVPFGGWEMPVWYSSLKEEHNAVRNNVGIFDVSHMGEIDIKGKDAVKFVNYLITNNVEKIKPEEIVYSPMLNENGGVIDDLLAYKYSDEHILLVVNASNIEKDYNWIAEKAKDFEVEVKNISDNIAQIAVQGPKAEEMLQEISGVDLKNISYYNFTEGRINGIECLISRTGYTGEDGFEIYLDKEAAVPMWRKLLELLPKYDGKPAGLGARDTLRLEATYLLYGNDMNDEITALEAGLKWAVDFEKDFIGKEGLLKEKEVGIRRRLKGIEMLEKGIPRHGYKVFVGDEEVGFITSGTVSPTLNKPIALAMLNKPYYKKDTEIEVEIRNKRVKAKVIKIPFYRGSVKTRK
ncbi:glycine cleavage system T protein [Marinitoga piezophila KA3]|uniref:Aminomethyltransferase n=1 Tax=Marinitoga piezophila (strain DSM 14283 / JCM 11233 / KA3) TaxID=443254 RepID=H2J381_MARPK|nr:glycine cleavage system aminomethyltransferase GcvT [Marinitoga piezophila]AEX84599.1 glycine cleavage system T protein [Marinitoga piezophila KA3]